MDKKKIMKIVCFLIGLALIILLIRWLMKSKPAESSYARNGNIRDLKRGGSGPAVPGSIGYGSAPTEESSLGGGGGRGGGGGGRGMGAGRPGPGPGAGRPGWGGHGGRWPHGGGYGWRGYPYYGWAGWAWPWYDYYDLDIYPGSGCYKLVMVKTEVGEKELCLKNKDEYIEFLKKKIKK